MAQVVAGRRIPCWGSVLVVRVTVGGAGAFVASGGTHTGLSDSHQPLAATGYSKLSARPSVALSRARVGPVAARV